jgi:hypothetical protein
MKFSSWLTKRLIDLLEEKRIVVWYDPDRFFLDFVQQFKAPHAVVISASQSLLTARRSADEHYLKMNSSETSSSSPQCMLVYLSYARGQSEEEKRNDPFEVYARIGVAFGDTESNKAESLARQALPGHADTITRLFREGNPTLDLLDDLEKSHRNPILESIFKSDSASEIFPRFLCDMSIAGQVMDTHGAIDELLRLADSALGLPMFADLKEYQVVRSRLSAFVLFSEFAFDLTGTIPEPLKAVSKASIESRPVIDLICNRMRSDSGLVVEYMKIAQTVQQQLHLAEFAGALPDLGVRDTFPFEEEILLGRTVALALSLDLVGARELIIKRRDSIWRSRPDRMLLWSVVERAATLLEVVQRIEAGFRPLKKSPDLLHAYTSGGWFEIDRGQRLFEKAVADCQDDSAIGSMIDFARRKYSEMASKIQGNLLDCVKADGWPPEGVLRQTAVFPTHVQPNLEQRLKVAYFLVDSLRYEMGQDLAEVAGPCGDVSMFHAAAVFPSVTDFGMAALMPKADGFLGMTDKKGLLVPALGTRVIANVNDRIRWLKEQLGDRVADMTLDDLLSKQKKIASRIANADLVVVRSQEIDMIGENVSGRQARKHFSNVISDIAAAMRLLAQNGVVRFVITSDHGHLLFPEIQPGDVVNQPQGEWKTSKRRCLLGKSYGQDPGSLIFPAHHVGIQGPIEEACVPLGMKVFTDGEGYFHGGISLQESVIPVIIVQVKAKLPQAGRTASIEVKYRSDRFTSRVIGLALSLSPSDVFGEAQLVRIEAFDGDTATAKVVGVAADCDARDPRSGDILLQPNKETSVPILIDSDFTGGEIEIRASDPQTRLIWHRVKLKNGMME